MNRQEFLDELTERKIEFVIDNENIILNDDVSLPYIITIPDNVQFNCGGNVHLFNLITLPDNVQFNNGGNVYLNSLNTLPENTQFNNGGNVFLNTLITLPENTQFNNGGNVYLFRIPTLPDNIQFNNGGIVYCTDFLIKLINTPYLKRFNIEVKDGFVILYKRVSFDYKTQENKENETLWEIGTTLEHHAWNPYNDECGAGKFHACARAHWCDEFRNKKDDKYISIQIHIDDLYEWRNLNVNYPQKIAFRKGKVLAEVNRN